MLQFIQNLPDQVWTITSTLIGGVISALAGYLAQKTIERRTKNELLMRRLEEIYEGCQQVYDGHLARQRWLSTRQEIGGEEWLSCPVWPGAPMSEIKMRLRSYAPHLETRLVQMDQAHQWFKDLSDALTTTIATNGKIVRGVDYDLEDITARQKALGEGANVVKLGVAERLRHYFG